nr:hypothetical protein [uncultured Sphaerochaeta sp.]
MNRFSALVKREVKTSQKDLFTYGLVIVLVMFASETLQSVFARYAGVPFPAESYNEMFPSFLLLGGFIISSLMFSEDMFGKDTQHDWLMLPATNLEKFLSKTLLMIVAYPIALVVLFFLISVVTEPIQLIIFGNPMAMFNPFRDGDFGILLAQYWVWTSVFLLGGTYFRKAHFIKTVLAIGVIALVLGGLGLLFTRIVFAIKFGSSLQVFDAMFYLSPVNLSRALSPLKVFSVIAQIFYYAVLPIFCLVTAFFRVEEVQATDAV